VALRNKKVDQLYIYQQSGGTLQVGDTSKATLDDPILRNVLAFKAYGSNLLTYVTDTNAPSGQINVNIWDNKKTYLLTSIGRAARIWLMPRNFRGIGIISLVAIPLIEWTSLRTRWISYEIHLKLRH